MISAMVHALACDLAQRVAARLNQALAGSVQRQGAIVIWQLLRSDELATLSAGIEANLARPSARAKIASRPDEPNAFSRTSATGSPTSPTGGPFSRCRLRSQPAGKGQPRPVIAVPGLERVLGRTDKLTAAQAQALADLDIAPHGSKPVLV